MYLSDENYDILLFVENYTNDKVKAGCCVNHILTQISNHMQNTGTQYNSWMLVFKYFNNLNHYRIPCNIDGLLSLTQRNI